MTIHPQYTVNVLIYLLYHISVHLFMWCVLNSWNLCTCIWEVLRCFNERDRVIWSSLFVMFLQLSDPGISLSLFLSSWSRPRDLASLFRHSKENPAGCTTVESALGTCCVWMTWPLTLPEPIALPQSCPDLCCLLMWPGDASRLRDCTFSYNKGCYHRAYS